MMSRKRSTKLRRQSMWKVRFRPATAKRKIHKYGRLVDESADMYYFRETGAKASDASGREASRFFMVLKDDAELFEPDKA